MGASPDNGCLAVLKYYQNHSTMDIYIKKVKSITMHTIAIRSGFFNFSLLCPIGIFNS